MRWPGILFDDKGRREDALSAAENRHRKRLLKREESTVRDLERTWRRVEADLTRRSDALAARIERAQEAGVEVSEAWLAEESRYQLLLRQTREQIDRYALGAMERTERAQRTNAEAGADDAQELMRRSEIRARFVRLPKEQVEALAGRMADGSPLAEVFATFGEDAAAAIKDALLTGLAVGDHPRKIALALQKITKEMGRDRAILNARVATIGAYRSAQIESYRANSDVVTGWRWTCARQTRTCPLCWAMHGTIHPLDKTMDTHLACRCTQSPQTANSPRRPTGEEEFAKLSARDQKLILGPGKYELYRNGRMSLPDVVEDTYSAKWGAGRRVRSLASVKENLRRGVKPEAAVPPAPVATIRPPGAKKGPQGRAPLTAEADEATRRLFAEGKVSVAKEGPVDEASRKIFGRRLSAGEWADVMGAPAGADIKIKAFGDGTGISAEATGGGLKYMARTYDLHPDGRRTCHNDYFKKAKDAPPEFGVRVFARQAESLAREGFDLIETHAAWDPPGTKDGFVGYYVWPRMGYDADIPFASVRVPLPKGLAGCRRVSELMDTKEGRQWWQEYGRDLFDAEFDLTEGSECLRRLRAYLAEKGVKFSLLQSKFAETGNDRRAEEIALEEIDEAAVARASGQVFGTRLQRSAEFRARVVAAGRESAWYREYPELVGPLLREAA
ncbi:MAG: phage minor head protein [Fimbriimonas sp.]